MSPRLVAVAADCRIFFFLRLSCCCVGTPHRCTCLKKTSGFLCPFIHGRTRRLSPCIGCCEQDCRPMGSCSEAQIALQDTAFIFFGCEVRLLSHMVVIVLTFWGSSVFFLVFVPVYSPTDGNPISPHPDHHLLIFDFLMIAIWTGLKRYLIVGFFFLRFIDWLFMHVLASLVSVAVMGFP